MAKNMKTISSLLRHYRGDAFASLRKSLRTAAKSADIPAALREARQRHAKDLSPLGARHIDDVAEAIAEGRGTVGSLPAEAELGGKGRIVPDAVRALADYRGESWSYLEDVGVL